MILAPTVAVRSIRNAVVDDIVINSKIRLGTSDNRAYPTSLTLHPNSSLRLELQIRSLKAILLSLIISVKENS